MADAAPESGDESFRARGNNSAGVPMEFSGELFFDGGVSSGFYCSFLTAFRQWADISGAKGWLRVPDFVHPSGSETAFEANRIKSVAGVQSPPIATRRAGHARAGNDMIRNFANQIFSGKLNDEWPMWALKTQKVMDACFESARRGAVVKL